MIPQKIITPEQQRCDECMAELQRVLQRYQCTILPVVTIIGNQIAQTGMKVVPVASPLELVKNGQNGVDGG